jgi:hypothetical protein
MELLFWVSSTFFPKLSAKVRGSGFLWIREFLPRLFPMFPRVNKVRICYGEHEGTLKLPRDSKF